ncbi:MAG: undecaprenyl-diphosphate phosphatase, partial [Pseudomonadota bacterium]|nr:undecaprenyl-diphosphate phosphatase [Pseudomonadota bacterium]
MPLEQIVVLALVQGITEFLPISSSGHLILIPAITHWKDQGLITDVMVHVGSLAAIIVYFWRDVLAMLRGALHLARLKWSAEARLAVYVAAATVPAVLFGLILKSTGMLDKLRGVEVVAWNALIFGVLLLAADMLGVQKLKLENITFRSAMIIGLAQAMALIPGTSRSGITMTAARFLGYQRAEAARFSFVLGIPAIAGAGLLTTFDAIESGEGISNDALLAAGLTFISA